MSILADFGPCTQPKSLILSTFPSFVSCRCLPQKNGSKRTILANFGRDSNGDKNYPQDPHTFFNYPQDQLILVLGRSPSCEESGCF